MEKKLILWNGRGIYLRKNAEPWTSMNTRNSGSVYIAAYSGADALRLIKDYMGHVPRGMAGEMRSYWSKGCWGTGMVGVKPERGIWLIKSHQEPTPIRLI